METRDVLFKKLCQVLHQSLVEARNCALTQNHQQLFDLADTFEILPTLMADWEGAHLELIRSILTDYQAKYPETSSDYLSILDMGDKSFLEVYCTRGGYQ
jgi:hypothetical protein